MASTLGSPITSLSGTPSGDGGESSYLTPGGSSSYGSYAPEPVEGNSLTKQLRSTTNFTGSYGMDAVNKGQQDYEHGTNQLQPILDLFQKLAAGDKDTTAGFIAPESDAISQQFGAIRNMVSATSPRGGGTASTFAEAPYEEARQKQELSSRYRMHALDAAPQIAGQQAQLGLAEAGQGLQGLGTTLNADLGRRGQNLQEDAANKKMISDLGAGIGQILAGVATGGASTALGSIAKSQVSSLPLTNVSPVSRSPF